MSTAGTSGVKTGISQGEWVEYTADNGKKYYYNRSNGQVTWDKPSALRTAAELALDACPWKEFISDTGKKYYHNSVTNQSVWDEPPEHKALREAIERGETNFQVESPIGRSTPTSPFSASTSSPISKEDSKSHEERVEAFKKLLDNVGVTSNWTWDMTMRAIINDERYKGIKTLSEKKQILAEFQAERRRQEREEKKKKENKLREDFKQMFKDNKTINAKVALPWRKVVTIVETDPRYIAVPEKEREGLYEEFLTEREKEEREAARIARKENMKKFRIKLESDPTINVTSQWRKVKESFKDLDIFKTLDKLDRLAVFEEYIRDLEREEEDKKRLDQYQKKRQSRINRDAFRTLLNEKYNEGVLQYNTKWKELLKNIRDDPRYRALVDPTQLGSLPSELFEDFIEELEEIYYKDKDTIKDILKEKNIVVTGSSKVEELLEATSTHPKYQSINPRNVQIIFPKLIEKAAEEKKKMEKETERKRKKIIHNFLDLLNSSKNVKAYSTYKEVREHILEHPAFKAIESEEEKEALFNEYISKRKEDSSDEEGRIRSDSPNSMDVDKREKKDKRYKKEKKDKKHRHKRHNEDDDKRDDRKRKKDEPEETQNKP